MKVLVAVKRVVDYNVKVRVKSDGSYLSANDTKLHFGLGEAAKVDAVIVQWPDGEREQFRDIKSPGLVTLQRGAGAKAVR